MGDKKHARFQIKLGSLLERMEKRLGIWAATELRLQVAPRRFRIPDLLVTLGEPDGRYVTEPPFLIVEILSEGDTPAGIQDRIDDYALGVPWIR